ncbi:MAG: YafY family protein [Candidatus Zixiibacteriota bacterium]|jgi:predicted DNA-binding transcriptional regulator YafY
MSKKKTERLFHIVNVLRSGAGYRAAELAELLGVSMRTIYRDIAELSDVIPIYQDRGYRIVPEPSVASLSFTREELLAVKLAVTMPPLTAASPYASATRSAVIKVEDQLARLFGETPDENSVTVHVKAYPAGETTVRALRDLEEAIRLRRSVEIEYFTFSRSATTWRSVDPYGLTFRRHSWYLVGYCHFRREARIFRVDRILSLRPTGDEFVRPEGFSVEEFFADTWEVYTSAIKAPVKLRFASAMEPLARPELEQRGKFSPTGNGGGVLFEGEVPLSDEFYRWLLTFGDDVEVLEPATLRSKIAAKLKAAAARYAGVAGGTANPAKGLDA